MLTERCYSIAKYLFDQKEPVTIHKLSEKFYISERTARYDLDSIEQWLKEKDVLLTRKSKMGISIDRNQRNYCSVKDYFNNPAEVQQVYSAEERQKLIRGLLLQGNKIYSVNELARKCNVSKSTITADLNEIEKWFNGFEVRLIRKPNYGIKLVFDERSWRNAVVNHIYEVHDKEKLLSLLDVSKIAIEEKSRLSTITKGEIFKVIGDISLETLEKCINDIENELGISFTDSALAGLLVHLGVAVNRIKLGKEIRMPVEQLKSLVDLPEFKVSKIALAKIQESCGIEFPEDEAGYFTMHVLGARVEKNNQDEHLGLIEQIQEDEKVIRAFISAVGGEAQVNLNNDKDLVVGLITHIKPAVSRAKYRIKIHNPILNEIKESYRNLFEIVKRNSFVLEEYFQINLNDSELGYIVMHLAAAVERNKKNNNNVGTFITAAVVCSSGLGTAKMLCSRIKGEFNEINVLYEMSILEFERFNKDSVDIILTTLPIDTSDYSNVLYVNALLTREDKKKIRSFIENYFTAQENSNKIIEKFIAVIGKSCDIKNLDILKRDLGKLLFINKKDNYIGEEQSFWELISMERIALKQEAESWEDAVVRGGELLYNSGSIKESYIKEMIENVKRFKGHVVIAPGVAMPHALPKEGVLKTSMSLITLKKPVIFGHPTNDPVDVILCLAAKDNNSHIKGIVEFMRLLENTEHMTKLRKAEEIQEAIEILEQI